MNKILYLDRAMDNHNSIIHGLFLIYICVNVWFSTARSEHIYTHLSKNEFILETFDKSAPKLFPSTPYIKARSVCPQCCTCCVRFASRGFIHIFNRLRRCFAPPPPFSLLLLLCGEFSRFHSAPIDYSYTRGNRETRVANKNRQFSIEGIEHVPKHRVMLADATPLYIVFTNAVIFLFRSWPTFLSAG